MPRTATNRSFRPPRLLLLVLSPFMLMGVFMLAVLGLGALSALLALLIAAFGR